MSKTTNWLTAAILSMSLLTVMAGAAVAPALGTVRDYFSAISEIWVQLIVSIPALFIILTSFAFPYLCRRFSSRMLALGGLVLYVMAGSGAYLCSHIVPLLVLRALLGVSVGVLLPLSTGLLAYYFLPERMAGLMGLSAFRNQMGCVVATLLAGLLCTISWNCAFLVYLGGLLAMLLVLAFLPDDKLPERPRTQSEWTTLRRIHPSVAGMLLLMLIFFIFPTNFAVTSLAMGIPQQTTTLLMVGLCFGWLMGIFPKSMKYVVPVCLLLSMSCFSFAVDIYWLVFGCVFVGIATGIGVPYLNTIASIKGGRESATTVMLLLSVALCGGQFISPLVVTPLFDLFFGADDIHGAYKVGVGGVVLYLLQTTTTRRYQMLPPHTPCAAVGEQSLQIQSGW